MASLPFVSDVAAIAAARSRLLVVAALPEEVAYVRDVETLVTGVGKAIAAAGLGRRLAVEPRPTLVVNVGTAGTLDASLSGLHEIDVVTQHDFPYPAIETLTAAAVAVTPRGYALSGDAPPRPLAAVPPDGAVAGRVLATGDTFIADLTEAARITALGVHLVDMEGYAYAATCHAFGVPLRCVKAISDGADIDAAVSWLDTIDGCARLLADWMAGTLSTG